MWNWGIVKIKLRLLFILKMLKNITIYEESTSYMKGMLLQIFEQCLD